MKFTVIYNGFEYEATVSADVHDNPGNRYSHPPEFWIERLDIEQVTTVRHLLSGRKEYRFAEKELPAALVELIQETAERIIYEGEQ